MKYVAMILAALIFSPTPASAADTFLQAAVFFLTGSQSNNRLIFKDNGEVYDDVMHDTYKVNDKDPCELDKWEMSIPQRLLPMSPSAYNNGVVQADPSSWTRKTYHYHFQKIPSTSTVTIKYAHYEVSGWNHLAIWPRLPTDVVCWVIKGGSSGGATLEHRCALDGWGIRSSVLRNGTSNLASRLDALDYIHRNFCP